MNLSHTLLAAALAPITALGVLSAATSVHAQYAPAPTFNSAVASPAVPGQTWGGATVGGATVGGATVGGATVGGAAVTQPAPLYNAPAASLYPTAAPQVVYSGGMAAAPAYPQAAYPQPGYPQPTYAQVAYPQAAYPQAANVGATVTPLYTPVTLFNWWRPRTLAGYMITPTAPTTVARPVYAGVMPVAAPTVLPTAAPVTAYYQPSYHPGGVVVATPPAHAVMSPIVASPPVYASPAVVAPASAPVVYARPVVGPRQAYLYSRGPLGFPRLDAVPAGTVVQPAAVPFVPVVLP
jgi:hypothetical protein